MTRKDFESIDRATALLLNGTTVVTFVPSEPGELPRPTGVLRSEEAGPLGKVLSDVKGMRVINHFLGQKEEALVKWKDIELA